MEQITKTKIKRSAKLSDIKVLTEPTKELLLGYENKNKGFNVELDEKETDAIKSGFKYSGKPENYLSSFRYAIARVFAILGYAKIPTGKDKTLIEDIKRVKYDSENKTLCFIFEHKNTHL